MEELDGKRLETITRQELLELITNHVRGDKTIDYKQTAIGGTDEAKRELLADVPSFANTGGGHLILGMREEAGEPIELCGLLGINPDAEVLRLESILRDGLEPRVPGIGIRVVPWQDSGIAIVIQSPSSWLAPHIVKFRAHSRFCGRTAAGKYPR